MTLKGDRQPCIRSNARNKVFNSVILHPSIEKRNILSTLIICGLLTKQVKEKIYDWFIIEFWRLVKREYFLRHPVVHNTYDDRKTKQKTLGGLRLGASLQRLSCRKHTETTDCCSHCSSFYLCCLLISIVCECFVEVCFTLQTTCPFKVRNTYRRRVWR